MDVEGRKMRRKTISGIVYVKKKYDQGTPMAQIARELGIPHNTAKYWLQSAKQFEKDMVEYLRAKGEDGNF